MFKTLSLNPYVILTFILLIVQPGFVSAQQLHDYSEEVQYPTFVLHGFGELRNYSKTPSGETNVHAGQQVAHIISTFSDRVTAFGEFSFTNVESDTDTDVERLILRYDFSDKFKLSVGKYHTPIGYWNSSYHHGAWLQTTIDRPSIMKYGSQIVPIHFEGVLAEGTLPVAGINLAYRTGFGTGIHNNITVHGDHGDTDGDDAFVLQLYNRPAGIHGLEIGASFYQDDVNLDEQVAHSIANIEEKIYSLHVALERESAEIIAEYVYWDHEQTHSAKLNNNGYGYYIQAAHRFHGKYEQLKPYARFDKIEADKDDVLFFKNQSFKGVTLGLRYDFADYAALKVEYRNERTGNDDNMDSLVVQVSFVWPHIIQI